MNVSCRAEIQRQLPPEYRGQRVFQSVLVLARRYARQRLEMLTVAVFYSLYRFSLLSYKSKGAVDGHEYRQGEKADAQSHGYGHCRLYHAKHGLCPSFGFDFVVFSYYNQ